MTEHYTHSTTHTKYRLIDLSTNVVSAKSDLVRTNLIIYPIFDELILPSSPLSF